MGEHKLRVTGNGDSDKPQVSSHIVQIVDIQVPVPGVVSEEDCASYLESAYQKLADRAKAEDSFILNVVQTLNVYQVIDVESSLIKCRMLVTITAQRIGREDLERQQRLQRMQGGGR